jgi:hypothetical protein
MDESLTELRARRRATRLVPGLVYLAVFGVAIAVGIGGVGAGIFAAWGVVYLVMAVLPEPRLFVGEHNIVVRRRRGGEHRYAWSSLRSTSWGSVGFGRAGPFVVPEGRPFDVPGPNSPGLVAAWFLPAPDLRRQFAAASEEHGVPFVGRAAYKPAPTATADS